jgi:hypothetical protein
MKPRQQSWKRSNVQVFWGEIVPQDHVVQFYQTEDVLLHTLEGFVSTGLIGNECVVLIATEFHTKNLEGCLLTQGFDPDTLKRSGNLITVNAEEALTHFVVDDSLDGKLFESYAMELLSFAKATGKKIRIFGEAVGLLVARGNTEAAIQLETLWSEIHSQYRCSVYCAYSAASFNPGDEHDMQCICKTHSRIIDGYPRPATVMYHRPA